MSPSDQSVSPVKAIRFSRERFVLSNSDAVKLSPQMQRALRDGTTASSDGGRLLLGYTGENTLRALRDRGLLKPHGYALSALGMEMWELFQSEKRQARRS